MFYQVIRVFYLPNFDLWLPRFNEYTISRHLKDCLTREKLKPENGGSESHLSDEQTHQLVEYISGHTYAHANQIVTYISERWSIEYTISGLIKWLHQQSFSYKKPKGVPHKANADKQDDFMENTMKP